MEAENYSEGILLEHIEVIADAVKWCCLDFSKLDSIKGEVSGVADFLGVSPVQAILFSALAEMSFHRSVDIQEMAKYLDCSVMRLMRHMNDIEALEGKVYVSRSSRRRGRHLTYGDTGYTVPAHVVDALRKGDRTLLSRTIKTDLPSFLRQIADLVDKRSEGELSTAEVLREVDLMITANSELPYVSFIDEALSLTESKCTLFTISYFRLKEQFHTSIESLADSLFEHLGNHLRYEQEITSGTHELIRKGMARISSSEFETDKTIMLAEKVVKKLYQAFPALLTDELMAPGMIAHKTVMAKELFFNRETEVRIREVGAMLIPRRFRSYCRSLRRNNFRPAVTAVFFGEAGTGKTEAVYQTARKTGRNIVMVDLSKTRSKWFGDSEKIVRQIFTDYESLRRNNDPEPILFINEADGLFGRRMSAGRDISSTDQTMNTIQNILLQSLENFEGILIVTTNLYSNLDKAFERRFTFRIELSRPDAECRRRIWLSKVPELTSDEAGRLAGRFALTGGDIDVHVKKILLRKVMSKKNSVLALLEKSCSDDQGPGHRRSVGYR